MKKTKQIKQPVNNNWTYLKIEIGNNDFPIHIFRRTVDCSWHNDVFYDENT